MDITLIPNRLSTGQIPSGVEPGRTLSGKNILGMLGPVISASSSPT